VVRERLALQAARVQVEALVPQEPPEPQVLLVYQVRQVRVAQLALLVRALQVSAQQVRPDPPGLSVASALLAQRVPEAQARLAQVAGCRASLVQPGLQALLGCRALREQVQQA
jgi:hypothetical protein